MNVKDLRTYKDSCYSALSRDLTEFEKNFLLVAGGILAFSITFIKDIIRIAKANFLPLLFIGWGLIIVSIGIMMYAFLKSANTSDELWKLTDDFIFANSLFNDDTDLTELQAKEIKGQISPLLNTSKARLKSWRNCAVISFLIGVLSFSSFVCINLINENKTSSYKSESAIKLMHVNDTLTIKNQNNE